MDLVNQPNSRFPSDFLPPETKASKAYSLAWAQSVDAIGINGAENGLYRGISTDNSNWYAIWRAYARGQQSIDKYKPILGVRGKRERKDPNAISYRVLNWEILDIASKYVNVLVGKLMKQNNDIGVNAVDKRAQDERRQKKMSLQEYVINKDMIDSVVQKSGIPMETPVQEDLMPPPQTLGEVDVHMSMFYKEDYCMVVQDMLKIINEQDNYTEILSEIARDLVEVAAAATKTYRVGNKIRRRRCIPERMIISSTNKATCDDIKYIGEYWDLTIGQFKEIAGDQLKEEDYKKIAEKAGNASFDSVNYQDYYRDNLCYPWDNTKITVLDLVWFSPDWETMQIKKNSFGNVEVNQKEFSWWKKLQDKGVTEKSFNAANDSEVVRYSLDNQYQAMLVKGTNYVVNFGKSKDMLKNQSSLGKTIGPFTVYKMKKCIIETIMPVLDNIQVQWLQFQHHAAKSVPAGPAIEFTALQDIAIEGKGGKNITPKQALQIYFETGVLLWRRRDASGNLSNYKPVEQMAGGISNAMEKHFSYMIQDINLLRDQIGLNELTDASTPNSEMGKAVAEMASGATDDALRPLHFGFDQINLGTHERTVMHISGMAATGLAPEYAEALGVDSMAKLALLSDLTTHELGVYLMKLPSNEMRARLALYLVEGTKPGGYLLPEEALEIEMEPNIWRAIRLIKMYRQQKTRDAAAQSQQQVAMNTQAQMQSADQSAKIAADAMDREWKYKNDFEMNKAQNLLQVNKAKASDDAFLMRMKAKFDREEILTQEEENRYTELLKIDRQGQYQLQVAKQNAEKKPTSV